MTISEALMKVAENVPQVYDAGQDSVVKAVIDDISGLKNDVAGLQADLGYTNSEIVRITAYSAKPQQIGLWIGNTPVWRTAFEVPVQGGVVDINIPLCYTERGVKLIDCDCFSNSGGLASTRNRKSEISFNGGVMNVSYDNDDGDTLLYGWVEFAADEAIVNPISMDECFNEYRQADGTYKLKGSSINNILIPVPDNLIGSETIVFSVKVRAASGQDVDIAYGDGTGVKLNSFFAASEFEELRLSNAGYPATTDSWFMIRCHSTEDEYLVIKDMVMGVG